MPNPIFDLRPTNQALGVQLQQWFLRPVSIVLYGLLLAPIIARSISLGDFRPLIIALGLLGCALWVLRTFIEEVLMSSEPVGLQSQNVAEALSFHMVEHLSSKPRVDARALLTAATESKRGQFVLSMLGVDRMALIAAISESPVEADLQTCIGWLKQASTTLATPRLDSTATLYAFFLNVPALKPLLNAANVSESELLGILRAEAFHFYLKSHGTELLSPQWLVHTLGSVGRTWVIGYNTDLERVTNNLSERAVKLTRQITIHEPLIDQVLSPLIQGQHSHVLLVGPTGCGRRTMIQNIARTLREHDIRFGTAFTDVLCLKTAELLAARTSHEVLAKALKDAQHGGRFVLILEDLPLLLKAADERLKEVLLEFLRTKNVSSISIVDPVQERTLLKTDPLLDELFVRVTVPAATDEESMAVLLERAFEFRHGYGVDITYRALHACNDLCRELITHPVLPGSALKALDDSVTVVLASGGTEVNEEEVRTVISAMSKVDVRTTNGSQRDTLLNLTERLQQTIVGQTHAISRIVDALKRSSLSHDHRTRPVGTFLLLGTTGVGKTETAKTLASTYFGGPEHFLRIDLNEYATEDSMTTLIGGMSGGEFREGLLTRRIQDQPASLILLDEIEKAHPKVLHLFLQILDEGQFTDGSGQPTNCTHTIIIATTNAGSRWLNDVTMRHPGDDASLRANITDQLIADRAFSAEFLNRFDDLIVFLPPTRDEMRLLTERMVQATIDRTANEQGISVEVDPQVIELLIDRGFHPEFGARELRRQVTELLDTAIANRVLRQGLSRGARIRIGMEDVGKAGR